MALAEELQGSGEFVCDFTFGSGEQLELRQAYSTLGQPRRDATTGRVSNAVLVLHGTTGSGSAFLAGASRGSFAEPLFGTCARYVFGCSDGALAWWWCWRRLRSRPCLLSCVCVSACLSVCLARV